MKSPGLMETKHSRRTEVEISFGQGGKEEGEERAVQITFEQAKEQAWSEIMQYLKGMDPYDFQDLVAALLRGMGYYVSWVSPPGKDGGIDILASRDRLLTRPPQLKVQVKRCATSVDVEGLRAFLALLGDDDVGIFVSTGGFTKDAQRLARSQERRKISLIDLETFFDLWVETYDKLKDTARRDLPIQPIYFLTPMKMK